MKIAVNTRFLLPNRLASIGRFTHEILRRLTMKYPQHEFYFFFDRAYDKQFIYSGNVKPIVVYPSARHPFLFYWWYQVSLAKALKKLQPDIFLSPDGMTTLNTTVPRVTVIHDLAYEHYPQDVDYLSRKYLNYYGPRFAQASDRIIAVSEFTRQDIIQQYNINPDKIAVVHNAAGVNFRKVNFGQQVAIRQKYAHGEAFFMFVGGLQARKNLINIFRAFDLFKLKTGSEVKLLMVGGNKWSGKGIKEAYNQMQFKSEVIFTGRVSDAELIQLYGAAVANVYVPTLAGFGITVVEAQQCGCPIITANTSAMPEVAGNGTMLVNSLAVEDITNAFMQVYHDLEVRTQLVQAGLQNANRFSWEQSAEKVMRVLEEVVNTQTKTRAPV
ncbi:MAG: glycosyltransferase family 4 protein [Adhaeribacter sp.]